MSLQKPPVNPTPETSHLFEFPHIGYRSVTTNQREPSSSQNRLNPPQPSKKRAKPGEFKVAEFFAEGKNTFQLSYLEIAKKQGIEEQTAKLRIKSDIKNGYITKEHTTYKSPKYKTLLDGRNKYHLTPKGRQKATHLNIPQRYSHSSNEECFAKSTAQESFPQQILQKYGLTKLVEAAPKWWFKDQQLLEKTLKLFNQKQTKGYKTKDPLRWISSVLKQDGMGFREKIAKETTKKLRGELVTQTPFEKEVLQALKSLKSKGLNTSHRSLQVFLSKGLLHLKNALTVLEKYLEWNKPIKSLSGMLTWLVRQKDPMELLKPTRNSPKKQIAKLKQFLTYHSEKFTFQKPTLASKDNKIHIEFFVHRKSPLSSFIKLYKKIDLEWKSLTLEMGKTTGNFQEVVVKKIETHFENSFKEEVTSNRGLSVPNQKKSEQLSA